MREIDYAFIVHARSRTDLFKKFSYLRSAPGFLIDFIAKTLPPVVVSRITGLHDIQGEERIGVIIGITMTAKQMLSNRDLALRRIIQAAKKAKELGAAVIGLGAMTASLSQGGQDVTERVRDIFVTTGRSYTVNGLVEYAEFFIQKFKLNKSEVTLGIVGAAGSIGSGVAVMMARCGIRNFTLIDLERKSGGLNATRASLVGFAPAAKVMISSQVRDILGCEIIIAATSAPEVVIKSEHLSEGAIVINDAQPTDVSPEVLKSPKFLVVEGGVVNSKGINCHFNFGLAKQNDIFSCLAETILLSYRGADSHHTSTGALDLQYLSQLKTDAKSLQLKLADPQNDLGVISEAQFQRVGELLRRRARVK